MNNKFALIFLMVIISLSAVHSRNIIGSALLLTSDTSSEYLYDNIAAAEADGLISYWSFDEGSGNTVYSQVNGNTEGTIYNALWSAESIFDSAIYFDGSGDYIQVPNSNEYNFYGVNYSFNIWLKPTDSTNLRTFWDKGYVSQSGWRFTYHYGGNNNIHFMGYGVVGLHTTSSNYPTGSWYMFSIIKSDTCFKVYVNAEYDTQHYNEYDDDNSTVMKFGHYSGYSGGFTYFKGYLDEPAMWRNKILSEDELSEIYNSGIGKRLLSQ